MWTGPGTNEQIKSEGYADIPGEDRTRVLIPTDVLEKAMVDLDRWLARTRGSPREVTIREAIRNKLQKRVG